ncbi:BA14K family protein [Devosia insulae]|uniref:BA14K family protein n=1 Tax=Devosia insulae TaxID=408174 RepID=UPI000A0548E2|nr:BA14K family protein [Devosia insulae]
MKTSAFAAVAAIAISVMTPLPADAQYRAYGFQAWDGARNLGYVNRWNPNRYYNRSYRPYYGGFGWGTGLFGFALGAALANSYSNRSYGGWDTHVARCEARYRSYDAGTDTFLAMTGGITAAGSERSGRRCGGSAPPAAGTSIRLKCGQMAGFSGVSAATNAATGGFPFASHHSSREKDDALARPCRTRGRPRQRDGAIGWNSQCPTVSQ